MEILEQDEVLELARRISQQGFAFITDKLAESFDTSHEPPTSAATFKEDTYFLSFVNQKHYASVETMIICC